MMPPLLQLVLFGYAINTTPRDLPTAVLLQETSDVGRSILAALHAALRLPAVSKATTVYAYVPFVSPVSENARCAGSLIVVTSASPIRRRPTGRRSTRSTCWPSEGTRSR